MVLLAICAGSLHAQTVSNNGFYRISVRQITSANPRVLGPVLAAGTPLQEGQFYNVQIEALDTSPYSYTPLIHAYRFDGFVYGYFSSSSTWVTYSTEEVAKDAAYNKINFDIKTYTGADFLPDVYMRIECYTPMPYSYHKKDSVIFP
ncbi:hypothetical protein CLV24_11730 [Pontibacter ummariensis]|uniref:Uncharacterized protein n=2 Tax=Pontibacter ummariensis TaxID=1610492 RepID=A0A239IGJ0_9BACT|nr:hypothetical protein CLV24_11730 [Pontibacter ummariensis]SNS92368.1 hypothetical protein SAMN06296052_11730 [Pontibacter ummariensis]